MCIKFVWQIPWQCANLAPVTALARSRHRIGQSPASGAAGVNSLPIVQKSTAPPVEVELKFQVLPGGEEILRADAIFGPAASRLHQITTYHDTPDHLLFAAGLTLRIRQENASFVQTVKSRDTGLWLANSRIEWEWPVANGIPDVGKLAKVPELLTIAGQIADRLEPVIVTDVWRTKHLVALADGAVAEVALDKGRIVSGALSEPICELELELKQGPIAPLYSLALRLLETVPMWISAQSKAARGWSLRNGTDGGALKLPKTSIGKKASVSAGLHQTIGALLSHLTANIASTLAGDPEALRQTRGALRQMRAVFALFRPMLDKGEVARFTGPLRQFAQTFGAARDWDVFCLQTLPAVMADLPQQDWTDLLALAREKRAVAHAAVQSTICGLHFTHLILMLALWAETLANGPQNRLSRRLSKIAPTLLDTFAAQARQAGRHPTRLSMPALHDYRKALDRLNTAIRFLGGAYPAQPVAAYRKRSDAVRDIIGAANDAQETGALADELADELAKDANRAKTATVNALCTWADKRQSDALTGLKQAARQFRRASEFWQP